MKFPFLDGDVPRSTSYGVYISQLIRIARVSSHVQGISEPEFYVDLLNKVRKIIGNNYFPFHFKKIIVRYKMIGYNIDVFRQTACLVANPRLTP